MAELSQLFEPRPCGAGIDRLGGEAESVADVGGHPGGDERGCGVEENGVAARAGLTREHPAHGDRVLRRRAAAQLVEIAGVEAERTRVELVLVDVALANLQDEIRPGRGELVEPTV